MPIGTFLPIEPMLFKCMCELWEAEKLIFCRKELFISSFKENYTTPSLYFTEREKKIMIIWKVGYLQQKRLNVVET